MRGSLLRVLEDTRNEANPNMCALCGAHIDVVVSQTSSQYEVSVYRCSQCGAMSFTLTEIYQESD